MSSSPSGAFNPFLKVSPSEHPDFGGLYPARRGDQPKFGLWDVGAGKDNKFNKTMCEVRREKGLHFGTCWESGSQK